MRGGGGGLRGGGWEWWRGRGGGWLQRHRVGDGNHVAKLSRPKRASTVVMDIVAER